VLLVKQQHVAFAVGALLVLHDYYKQPKSLVRSSLNSVLGWRWLLPTLPTLPVLLPMPQDEEDSVDASQTYARCHTVHSISSELPLAAFHCCRMRRRTASMFSVYFIGLVSHNAAANAANLQDDEEDSKYAYNSDDDGEPDYGMANEMDI
jgi:hypothetical protein